MQSCMIGVLVDVSGSMREALALDKPVSGKVKRTHAIITTLNKIAKNAVTLHQRRYCIRMFVEAFGLEDTSTCDLISLLKYISKYDSSKKASEYELRSARKDIPDPYDQGLDGIGVMIKFACDHNAPHAARWIKKSLSEPEAGVLYTILSRDEELMEQFIKKLPDPGRSMFLNITSTLTLGIADVSQRTIEESELYKLAHDVINRFANVVAYLKQIQRPVPQPAKEVSDLLDELLDATCDSSSRYTKKTSTTIAKLFDHIKHFIFGGTPMKKALMHAKEVFDQAKADQNVLFILSDGGSADGDPLPIAEELQRSNVTIISCFLTSNSITQSKCLLYAKDPAWEDPKWDRGVQNLFDMSSRAHNTEIPVTYFTDAKWKLPIEGESRLFLQANSLDMVEEFVDIVSTHIKEGRCVDAIATMLATVSVATYINVANSEFKPSRQRGRTCYANAIAAVYHLAMRRIVDREGGVPEFSSILKTLTEMYVSKAADTKMVLAETCKSYRLHFNELNRKFGVADEIGARNALNQRRPVVATFFLDHWFEFSKFYRDNPKGILEAQYLAVTGLLNQARICKVS